MSATMRGIWAPASTPLHHDLAIDAERYAVHVAWLLRQGCHGVAVFGTTGEATSFAVEERRALLERLLDTGIDPQRLIVGTGCAALTDTVRLTSHALELGCHQVLMLPPFYYKGVSDNGVLRSYAEVIERVGAAELRICLYHFPRLSGVPITPALIERLARDYPRVIIGIKDSSGDWDHTRQLIERFPDLAIFPGSEAYLLQALTAGAAGCICATANVNARGIRRIWDLWRAGSPAAEAAQETATAVRAAIEPYGFVPALKQVLAHDRKDAAWLALRPPLTALTGARGEALIAELYGRFGFSS